MDIDLRYVINLILLNVTAREDQDPGEARPEPTPSWSIERDGAGEWEVLRHHDMQREGPVTAGRVSMNPDETFDVCLETDAHYTRRVMSLGFQATWEELSGRQLMQVVLGFLQDLDEPKHLRPEGTEPERVISGLARYMVAERPSQIARERWVAEMDEITRLITGYRGVANDWTGDIAGEITFSGTEEVRSVLGAHDWDATLGEKTATLMEERWRHGVGWDEDPNEIQPPPNSPEPIPDDGPDEDTHEWHGATPVTMQEIASQQSL